mgnify:CR=1 FL=1
MARKPKLQETKEAGQIHLILTSPDGLSFEGKGATPEQAVDSVQEDFNSRIKSQGRWKGLGFEQVVNRYLQENA